MKVNNEKNDEEANASLEATYSVEPGYVKQMIDRFSSGLSRSEYNAKEVMSGEEGLVFKLPLLHSTRTKTHEPFQYPVLLANRSAVPVRTSVTMRGGGHSGSKMACSGPGTGSTGSVGSGSNLSNSSVSNNINSSNIHVGRGNNNGMSLNEGGDKSYSIRQSSPKLQKTPSLITKTQTSIKSAQLNQHDITQRHQHNNHPPSSNVEASDVKNGVAKEQYSSPPLPPSTLTLTTTNNHHGYSQHNKDLNKFDLHLNLSETKEAHFNKDHNFKNSSDNGIDEGRTTARAAASEAPHLRGASCGSDLEKAKRDGHYFLSLMAQKGEEMVQVCEQFQTDLSQASIDEGVQGKIRSAIGKANLLLSKKFKQFDDLCAANLTSSEIEQFQVTNADLEGFWDMMLIQVADIEASFHELQRIKLNHWKDLPTQPPPFQSPTSKHPPCHRFDTTPTSTAKSSKLLAKSPCSKSKGTKGRSSGLQAAMQEGRRQRKTSQSDDVVIFVTEKAH